MRAKRVDLQLRPARDDADPLVLRIVAEDEVTIRRFRATVGVETGWTTSPGIERPSEIDALAAVIGSPTDERWRGWIDEARAASPGLPVVLAVLFPTRELWRLGTLPTCRLFLPQEGMSLAHVLARLEEVNSCAQIERHLLTMIRGPSLLESAIRSTCRWRPGRLADRSIERLSVRLVARRLRCSPSALYGYARSNRISLSALGHGVVVLRGLQLRERSEPYWTNVATRLGFASLAAWSNFVRRHWHLTPTESLHVPRHDRITRVLVATTSGGRDRGENVKRSPKA